MKLLLLCLLMCSVSFAQAGKITGRVIDENGEPVFGAAVEVMELPGRGAAVNDAESGRFEIDRVPDGVYSLRVTSIGFETKYLKCIAVSASEPKSITIRLNQESGWIHPDCLSDEHLAEMNRRKSEWRTNNPQALLICGNLFDSDYFELCDRGILLGSVRGSQCERISSCDVFMNDQKVELIPDEHGNWRIGKVVPGVYTFRVAAEGFAPFEQDSVVIERCHQHEITVTLKREDSK